MLNTELILKKAIEIVTQCGTRNDDNIAQELGVIVLERENFKNLLGMYAYRRQHRFAFLSDQRDEVLYRIILANEIAHNTLHRSLTTGDRCLQEFTLFDIESVTESEANALVAHLLIDDADVYSLAKQDYDLMQISQMLNFHVNLMLIKMQEMNRMGYDFKMPCTAQGKYLKNVKARGDGRVCY